MTSDLDRLENRFSRYDNALEKLTEITTNIRIMMGRFETRIEDLENELEKQEEEKEPIIKKVESLQKFSYFLMGGGGIITFLISLAALLIEIFKH